MIAGLCRLCEGIAGVRGSVEIQTSSHEPPLTYRSTSNPPKTSAINIPHTETATTVLMPQGLEPSEQTNQNSFCTAVFKHLFASLAIGSHRFHAKCWHNRQRPRAQAHAIGAAKIMLSAGILFRSLGTKRASTIRLRGSLYNIALLQENWVWNAGRHTYSIPSKIVFSMFVSIHSLPTASRLLISFLGQARPG